MKEQIEDIIYGLAENEDSIPAILDILTSKDVFSGFGAIANSLWQAGPNLPSIAYAAMQVLPKLGKDPIKTLLQEGLIETLVTIHPDILKVMIKKVSEHPIAASYKELIKDLNDPEFLQAVLSNKDLILQIYDKAIEYQQSDASYQKKLENYNNLPENAHNSKSAMAKALKKSKEDIDKKLKSLTSSMVSIKEDEKVIKHLTKLLTPKLVEDIFNLEALSKKSELIHLQEKIEQTRYEQKIANTEVTDAEIIQEYSQLTKNLKNLETKKNEIEKSLKPMKLYKDFMWGLTAENPDKFKEFTSNLLASEDVYEITNKLLTYVSSSSEDLKKNPQIWNDFLSSVLKLGSEPEILKKIAPLFTNDFVEKLYSLQEMQKDGQKEIKELLQSLTLNPEYFKPFVQAAADSKHISEVSKNLTTYLTSTKENLEKNPQIWNDFLSSVLKLGTEAKTLKKMEPLLTNNLFYNVLKLPALNLKIESVPEISVPAQRIVHAFSENEESLPILLEILQSNLKPKKDSNIIEAEAKTEEIPVVYAEIISNALNDEISKAALGLKQAVAEAKTEEIPVVYAEIVVTPIENVISKAAPELKEVIEEAKNAQEITAVEAEISKNGIDLVAEKNSKSTSEKKIDYFKLAPVLRRLAKDEEFQEYIKNGKIENFLKEILPKNEEAKKWGLNAKETTLFIKKIASKDALNEIANYLEGKSSILKILGKTETRSFIVKHLSIRAANWIIDLPMEIKNKFKPLNTPALAVEQNQAIQKQ